MINFDAVEFSERCSEEVISFFWRSVYYISLLFYINGIILRARKKILREILNLETFTFSVLYSILQIFPQTIIRLDIVLN